MGNAGIDVRIDPRTGDAAREGTPRSGGERKEIVLGLLAAPGMVEELADELGDDLRAVLSRRFPNVVWDITVHEEPLAAMASAGSADLVELARRRMLEDGWELAICLTNLPLLKDRRPVTAYASSAHGVGVVSVPALGAVALDSRVEGAVVRVVERLLGEKAEHDQDRRRQDGRSARMRARLDELAAPVGEASVRDDGTVRFMTAVVRGNLRLLLGMVRANRPWRLAAGLYRALTAAIGTAAFGLASTGVWHIADGLSIPRSLAQSLAAVAVTCATLIVVHRLWERSPPGSEARERVALFNLATTITVALGALSLYVALLAILTACAIALITPDVLGAELGHPANLGDYLQLTVVLSMLATVGGALGAALESDDAVREAAYGYHADD